MGMQACELSKYGLSIDPSTGVLKLAPGRLALSPEDSLKSRRGALQLAAVRQPRSK